MKKNIAYPILLLMSGISSLIFCQPAGKHDSLMSLPNSFTVDTVLAQGNYLVPYNIIVSKEAEVTISAGSIIHFNPGMEILVYGGLKLLGEPHRIIRLLSSNPHEEGVGISFSKPNENKSVYIAYSDFNGLLRPLNFEDGWLRKSVYIGDNSFTNITTGDAGVVFGIPDNVVSEKTVPVSFTRNVFSDNGGKIKINEFSCPNWDFDFSYNVICGNDMVSSAYRATSNALYGSLNSGVGKSQVRFKGNVFFDNSCYSTYYDSLLQGGCFGVEGTSDSLDISLNYWGAGSTYENLYTQTYGFHSDRFSPRLKFFPLFDTIPSQNHPFISKMVLHDSIEEVEGLPLEKFLNAPLVFSFSKPLPQNQQPVVTAVTFHPGTKAIVLSTLENKSYDLTYNSITNYGVFTLLDTTAFPAYLLIHGFFDSEGVSVPAISIGKRDFYKKYGQILKDRDKVFISSFPVTPPSQTANGFTQKKDYRQTIARSYELGVLFGGSIYYGDIGKFSPGINSAMAAYGVRGRYSFTNHLSASASVGYTHVSADDKQSENYYKRLRDLNFSTQIIDLTFLGEFNLVKYPQYRGQLKVIPAIGAGFSVFYFNPQSTVDGISYSLRNIGTEGQTSVEGMKKYSLLQISTPLKASLALAGHRFSFGVETTFFKTFTDYLDDASGVYPQTQGVIQANPQIDPDVVAKLVNPSLTRFKAGDKRGNPEKKDAYLVFGIFCMVRL